MKQRTFWTLLCSVAVVLPILFGNKDPLPRDPVPPALDPDIVTEEGRWQSFEGLMFEKRGADWYDVMTGEKCKLVKVGSHWRVGPRTVDGDLLKQLKARQDAISSAF